MQVRILSGELWGYGETAIIPVLHTDVLGSIPSTPTHTQQRSYHG